MMMKINKSRTAAGREFQADRQTAKLRDP